MKESIFSFINFLILVYFYNYLVNLEKTQCICALNSKWKFLKNFFLITAIYQLAWGIFSPTRINSFLAITMVLHLTFTIISLYYTLKYINELDKTNCICSESLSRTILYLFTMIKIFIILLLVLMLINNYNKF